ncbi:hypothetical protein FSP39_024788 [Pinctada imbricata]|uniref:Formin-binding protein 1-like n=1 Tax=Pinctada imbricata TaxID=66713 RepID=A0AA88XR50_PINIB|nr:hypothetical protein FSP39_024788 [Pinctada imbricata]
MYLSSIEEGMNNLKDQYDTIAAHTQKGIDFSERFSHFLKERCSIELEYAKNLKRLVKNYQPKKKEEEEYQYSWAKGFWDLMRELHDLAGQHEVIAENIQAQVIKDLNNVISDGKSERKKCLQEGSRVQDHLKNSLAQLDKSRKTYERAFKDAEKATDAYRKADADINLSRAEVEKHRNQMLLKNNQCDECKNDYAAQLQQTNGHQKEHYTQQMPAVFQQLQNLDENRINKMKDYVNQCATIERNVIPIINTCIDGMVKASDSISATEDSKLVIERYKSGFPIPEDIPFDDLSATSMSESVSSNGTPKSNTLNANSSSRGTVSGKKAKREKKGLFNLFGTSKGDEQKEDFSDLPPNQRRKALQKKIDSIKKEVARETAERQGMLKMKEVYAQNPALGDPNSLEKKIEENGQKVDALNAELRKFQGYLAEAEGKQPPAQHHPQQQRRNSLSDDSVSQSPSEGSVQNINAAIPNAPQPPTGELYTEIDHDEDDHLEEEFNDDDQFPVIGTCRALYPFEAENEGSVNMEENEEMFVLEMDQGDGWTRVRKKDNSEGFVPTSYIQCHFYDQDEV